MEDKERTEFLLHMYDQLWNSISRHILVVWQSVGVLVGAFALFTLVDKQMMSLDWAAGLIVLLCGWSVAHVLDASLWYNRNLVIVANIERQFLCRSDIREIHYFFTKHRSKNKMINHFRIQLCFGFGVADLILLYHLLTRIVPVQQTPHEAALTMVVPYVVAVAVIIVYAYVARARNDDYQKLLDDSPGRSLDSWNAPL